MDLFSCEHLVWIATSLVFFSASVSFRAVHSNRTHMMFRFAIAAIIFINELWWTLFRHFSLHVPVRDNLPLHLCDLSVFIALGGLLLRKPFLRDLVYFVGIPAALLAILFPVISEGGSIYGIAVARFFITHIAILGTGGYLTVGSRYVPPFRSVITSYITIHLYALAVFLANLLLGTNYFYIMKAADSAPGFLKAMPLFWYLTVFSAFFFAVFTLLWFILNRVPGGCRPTR